MYSTYYTNFFTLYANCSYKMTNLEIALIASLGVCGLLTAIAIAITARTYIRYEYPRAMSIDYDYLEGLADLRRMSNLKTDIYTEMAVQDTLDYMSTDSEEMDGPQNTPRSSTHSRPPSFSRYSRISLVSNPSFIENNPSISPLPKPDAIDDIPNSIILNDVDFIEKYDRHEVF